MKSVDENWNAELKQQSSEEYKKSVVRMGIPENNHVIDGL